MTARFYFDSIETAARALILVLEDARVTTAKYGFGTLSADQVLASGLLLVGDIESIASRLERLDGAFRSDL